MKPYLEWIEQDGYWIRNTWDEAGKVMKGAGYLHLFPIQKRIIGEALKFDERDLLAYETIMYSTTKKSGKTAIAASVGAWYAECGPAGSEIFCVANDLDSAEGRLFRDIKHHYEHWNEGKDKKEKCKITTYRIDFPNGTYIEALSNSYKSAAGSRHGLTLWDELWGYTSEMSRRTWDELTPIPTVTNSLRFVATYAGFENESDLLWDMYQRGVGEDEHPNGRGKHIEGLEDLPVYHNGKLFTYWNHDPTMPWQTEEYYDEQMQSERPSAFLRLHQNMWVTSHESFLPVEWWDIAARSYKGPAHLWEEHPYKDFPITIGVDAGQKRDSTALVGVAYDAKKAKLGVVFHKIWTPSSGDIVDLDATVEKELLELYNKYKVVSIVYDQTHLIQTMFRLKNRGLPVSPYNQDAGNMTACSQLLYDLFKNHNLETYPDETMRRHIQMSVAETTSRGFRIVKTKTSKRHHIDGAIALAMAAYEAVSNGGVDITIPVAIRSPFSDKTMYVNNRNNPFPPQLRSDNDEF